MQGGYTQSMPLSDLEWRVLPVLMAGRLVASTVFGLDTVSRVRLVQGVRWKGGSCGLAAGHSLRLLLQSQFQRVLCAQDPSNAAYVLPDVDDRW